MVTSIQRPENMILVDGGLYCLRSMLKAFDFFPYALFYYALTCLALSQ